MERIGKPQRVTATGLIPYKNKGAVYGGLLTPAAAAASAVFRDGGAGGTIILTVNAVANGQSVLIPAFDFDQDLHVTLTGASAEVTVMM